MNFYDWCIKNNPQLLNQWSSKNDCTPFEVMSGSNKKYWFKCPEGHEYLSRVSSRKYGYGCPICANLIIVPGINDLKTINPKLSKEWSNKNKDGPEKYGIHSHKEVWWECDLGHSWRARIDARTNGTGCPICSHKNGRASNF